MGSAVVLTMLTGCVSGQSESGESAEAPPTEASVTDASPSGDEVTTERPRETVDPCEGRNDDFLTHIACDVVAWVDLDLDGSMEPIAIATGGEPSINLLTVVDGQTVEYSPTYDSADPTKRPIGPDVGSMEARRHAAFVGAYDMTGDGRPELVMWADKGPTVDEFRVIRATSDGLIALDTPLPGMHGGGKSWVHYLDPGMPTYRCTGDADTPLEYLASSAGEPTATRYEFNESTEEFVSLNEPRPTRGWTGEVPTVGIDCPDLAEHEPAPSPEEYERCPLGQLPGSAQTDDVGAFIEGKRVTGDIGCDQIVELWNEYKNAPKDQLTNGMALIVDFEDHTCSMPSTVGGARERGIGGCTAMDQSWAFDVVRR